MEAVGAQRRRRRGARGPPRPDARNRRFPGSSADPTCEDDVVRKPAPLAQALAKSPAPAAAKDAIQDVNDLTRRELNHAAADNSLWVDYCGDLFFVDAAHPHADDAAGADTHDTAQAAPRVDAASVPANVLDLSSRPDSDHTIYLDFTGGTVSGTAWNTPQWTGAYGTPIDVTPYSITAPADLNFTAAERAEIYTAWATVSEDYAPFDVNVTTLPPSTDALTRYSLDDSTYGVTVKVTNSGPIYASCGCGGIAYLDIFSEVGAQSYNPAWVFTAGTTTSGYELAQAATHEAGHTFGLSHDGTDRNDYYSGSGAYAPIMGASYSRRVSHWSNGEYPGADNYEDDVAIIASQAPKLFDDHGDNAQNATPVAAGETIDGLIGDRTDIDAFSFTGEGESPSPPPDRPACPTPTCRSAFSTPPAPRSLSSTRSASPARSTRPGRRTCRATPGATPPSWTASATATPPSPVSTATTARWVATPSTST
ncbi:zinc-dependent metalloprotease family protein [Paenarthrobacter sp. C1]|uniref:zinc-dependent metalloprotease family protein n=1 Tax=Paenarthrobacter sp. C1 TaxID=3400220 RepID=UPI003BF55AB6